MARYYPLKVASVRHDTRDAVVVSLAVPEELRTTFAFRAGQHLNVRAQVGGEELRRSYSICAAPGEPLRIGIKRASGGRFSAWANDALAPRMTLEALPPTGRFHAPVVETPIHGGGHALAIAAGSGITPVYAVVKAWLRDDPANRVTLWYGNRASSTIMLREELAELKDIYLDRFTLVHVMSREHQDIDLFNGRLTAAKCGELLDHWCQLATVDLAFVCGPHEMNREVAELLAARGLPPGRILVEKFVNAQPAPQALAAPLAAPETCAVEVVLDGRRHAFEMEKGRETILAAGLRHGLEMRYSCQSGVCATCRAKLVTGQVDMDGNFALEDYEIARGFILTCQSYPVTERVVVDFDQDS